MSDTIDMDQVNRLGFEVWADNVIQNCVEQGWTGIHKMTFVEQGAEVVATFDADSTHYAVRAYVPGEGFKCHERVIKR